MFKSYVLQVIIQTGITSIIEFETYVLQINKFKNIIKKKYSNLDTIQKKSTTTLPIG